MLDNDPQLAQLISAGSIPASAAAGLLVLTEPVRANVVAQLSAGKTLGEARRSLRPSAPGGRVYGVVLMDVSPGGWVLPPLPLDEHAHLWITCQPRETGLAIALARGGKASFVGLGLVEGAGDQRVSAGLRDTSKVWLHFTKGRPKTDATEYGSVLHSYDELVEAIMSACPAPEKLAMMSPERIPGWATPNATRKAS